MNGKKRIAVVTGGTKGVGAALAAIFGERGDTVIVLARGAEDTETSVKCDVTEYSQVDKAFTAIFARYGQIDLLINNVGAGLGGAVEFLSPELLDGEIKTNLMSAVYCTKAVLMRTLPDTPLKIVNISSVGAFGVQPFRTMYSVSKAGLNTFTVGMRSELHGSNVAMCAVTLGDTATDFGKHHENDFRTSPRYGDRIEKSDGFSAERSGGQKRDRRMPVEKAAKTIARITDKKVFRKALYFVGAKYRILYGISRFLSPDAVTETVRRIFER